MQSATTLTTNNNNNSPMIYASFGVDEQLGWMSRPGPECVFSQSDPYLQHILKNLHSSTTSPFPKEYIKWLYHWCGAYECIRTFNESQLTSKNYLFSARVSFLKNSWKEENFRPFDNIEQAIKYLQDNPNRKCTLRLSTTKPGFITVTTKNNSSFTHTRYQILQNACIVDENGTQHKSIASLTEQIESKIN